MKVHELLTDASRWTQGAMARSSDDRPLTVSLALDDGCKFCLVGALIKCYPLGARVSLELGNIRARVGGSPAVWNDDPRRTFAEVLALVVELDI